MTNVSRRWILQVFGLSSVGFIGGCSQLNDDGDDSNISQPTSDSPATTGPTETSESSTASPKRSESIQGNWPMFRYDSANTGNPKTATADDGTKLWDFETNGQVQSSPAIKNGTLYVGSQDGNLYALDVSTGEQKWVFETEHKILSSPAVANGSVYITDNSGVLHVLAATDGTKQVSVGIGAGAEFIQSSPTVKEEMLYIGGFEGGIGGSGVVMAIDMEKMEIKWVFTEEVLGAVYSTPAVVDNTVYFGAINGLYALDTATGEKQWLFGKDHIRSSPAVKDGRVYFGTLGGDHPFGVYALRASDGTEQWRAEYPQTRVDSSPAIHEDTIYIGVGGAVVALSTSDGTEKWRFSAGKGVFSSPAVVDDTVYVGSIQGMKGRVYALDVEDGTKRWQFNTDHEVLSSPAVVDGTVFIGSDDNYVYALQ